MSALRVSSLVPFVPSGKDYEASRRAGHVLTIFRRSTGGAWLLSRDANLLTAEETPE
jgi:hypothetical protein